MTDFSSISSWLRWWPCFVGGLFWPVFSMMLRPWLAAPYAAALAFAVLFLAAGVIFVFFPPFSTWRFSRWSLGAIAGTLICGVMTQFFPWC